MMAAIFATLTLAIGANWAGRTRLGVGALLVTLALAVHLFLWEIWSPETGFRMPWIQTALPAVSRAA